MFCFVDYRITNIELENLTSLGLTPIKVPKSPLLYEAIDGHVDIQVFILDKDKKTVLVHKDMPKSFLNKLKENKINYILSDRNLDSKYPFDIPLNVLKTKHFIMHNLKYTDPKILKFFKDKKLLNTKQGYTKCSVLPLSNNSFITSDKSIYTTLLNEGLNVLLVPPGDISLPPLDYGFIGGVGGMIDENTLALFGDLDSYAHKDKILEFLAPLNIKIVSLKKGTLSDRGSLLVI